MTLRKNGDSSVKKYERKFNGKNTSQLRVRARRRLRKQGLRLVVQESYCYCAICQILNLADTQTDLILANPLGYIETECRDRSV